MGRSQRGNNNAYCQDNEISWVRLATGRRRAITTVGPGTAESLLDFTQRLIRLRRDHPVLRRRRYLQGGPVAGRTTSSATSRGSPRAGRR